MDWKFDMELLEPDLDRIADHLEKGMDRIPEFKDVGIKKIICGPITHTPDDNFLAGPGSWSQKFLDVLCCKHWYSPWRWSRKIYGSMDCSRRL
jgi:glycine/D-amino acid oxidase-like deaminating enzyme